jgi:branched-chain amino acid transport system substrate-binding protein
MSGCANRTVPVTPARPQAPGTSLQITPPGGPEATAPTPPLDHLVDVGRKTNVALLLPLSAPGRIGVLGRDMLSAAELSLTELANDDLALTPKDTKGTPAGAADAARRAVAEGAKLILGPLTAAEIEAVRPIAQQANINVLAFSNVARAAGGGVFVIGVPPQQEVRRVTSYARSIGVDHFAVLAPSNAYGQLATDAFKSAVNEVGGTLDHAGYYDPAAVDLRPAAKRLSAGGAVTFTALLLPDPEAQRLKTLASLLPAYSIDPTKVHLIGTGGSGDGWEAPTLGTETALVGGWYAAPSPDARAGFEQHFVEAFGHKPQRLATLAYDAVGVAAVLQRTPRANFSANALTNPSGFAGADGIFRLLADGTVERGLAVLQVERGGSSVVDPAPESFEPSGQ